MPTTLINPDSVPVLGQTSVLFVPAVTLAGPKVATELEITGTLNVSLLLHAEAYNPGQDVGRGTSTRRVGQSDVCERFTTRTLKLDDLKYVIQPQAASGTDGKKPYEVLLPGLQGFFLERLGVPIANAWTAVTNRVNIIPVTLGPRIIVGDTDENGEYSVMQAVAVRAGRVDDVALAA